MTNHLTVLDLFCGPGGLSQGIKDATNHDFKFRVVVANDYNEAVRSTYTRNHKDVVFVPGSITDASVKKEIMQTVLLTGRQGVDLVVGGPPCKGFSLENRMTRNMDNPMNHLVSHYIDMVRRATPQAFIMENVPGLLAMNRGGLVKDLMERFASLGYHNVTTWLLNAVDYGAPQSRKRAFIVGSKSRVAISPPRKTHGSPADVKGDPSLRRHVRLMDAISDLPRIRAGDTHSRDNTYTSPPKNKFQESIRRKSKNVTNHVVTKNGPTVINRIKAVPPGGNWSNIPVDLLQVDGKYNRIGLTHSMIYKRLEKNRPSITITNFRKAMIIHPTQHRLLSVREAARIQTFPDHFEFMGSIGQMQQQVSDAVPTLLARSVGEAMLSHLHKIMEPMMVNGTT